MKVTLAYGKRGLPIELPDGPAYKILEAYSAPPLLDVRTRIEAALDAPIGSLPLIDLASGRKSAAISVCDITRPAPNSLTLPPLLRRLQQAGIPREKITIFIATGLHRPATRDELDIILGPEIAATYHIVNHDARLHEAHRFLGETGRGTPIYIEKRFHEADLHITLGFIEQHLMLGFSGGRKLIAPGLAGQETIKVIHSPRFMREVMAVEGSIDQNPLHAELLEIARMVRHDFMLDVTLNHSREISGVFAGEPVKAHSAGVAAIREGALELLEEPVDAVITSAAGHPLDLTFYQTIKGITAAQHILAPKGPILVMGECAEGIGSPEFAHKLSTFRGYREYLDEIRTTAVEVDQWQLEKLALVGLRHPLSFYTPGVLNTALGSLSSACYDDPQLAITQLIKTLPRNCHVAVVPDGPYVYARVREPQLQPV
jgi:nickel-dependent lactate racemase